MSISKRDYVQNRLVELYPDYNPQQIHKLIIIGTSQNNVEKIGGWRMYAKEAVLPDAADKAATSAGKKELHGEHGGKP